MSRKFVCVSRACENECGLALHIVLLYAVLRIVPPSTSPMLVSRQANLPKGIPFVRSANRLPSLTGLHVLHGDERASSDEGIESAYTSRGLQLQGVRMSHHLSVVDQQFSRAWPPVVQAWNVCLHGHTTSLHS